MEYWPILRGSFFLDRRLASVTRTRHCTGGRGTSPPPPWWTGRGIRPPHLPLLQTVTGVLESTLDPDHLNLETGWRLTSTHGKGFSQHFPPLSSPFPAPFQPVPVSILFMICIAGLLQFFATLVFLQLAPGMHSGYEPWDSGPVHISVSGRHSLQGSPSFLFEADVSPLANYSTVAIHLGTNSSQLRYIPVPALFVRLINLLASQGKSKFKQNFVSPSSKICFVMHH